MSSGAVTVEDPVECEISFIYKDGKGILVGGFDGFFMANNDQNDDTTNAPNELNQIKSARATVSVFHAYAAVCVLQVLFTHVLLA